VEQLDDATYVVDAANPAAHPSTVRLKQQAARFPDRNFESVFSIRIARGHGFWLRLSSGSNFSALAA